MMSRSIAGIALPEGAMAQAATAAARNSEPSLLFRHSMRVFLFASLIGRRRGLEFDANLLYVAALFHDIGLMDAYRHSRKRFEVDSANAADAFLSRHQVSQADRDEAWRAVALHTTFGIPAEMATLTALLSAGVETDLLGLHFEEISDAERIDVLREFPRGTQFKERIIDTLAQGMASRPATTFGTVNADVLDRCDPNYRRLNFCGLILGSSWKE